MFWTIIIACIIIVSLLLGGWVGYTLGVYDTYEEIQAALEAEEVEPESEPVKYDLTLRTKLNKFPI